MVLLDTLDEDRLLLEDGLAQLFAAGLVNVAAEDLNCEEDFDAGIQSLLMASEEEEDQTRLGQSLRALCNSNKDDDFVAADFRLRALKTLLRAKRNVAQQPDTATEEGAAGKSIAWAIYHNSSLSHASVAASVTSAGVRLSTDMTLKWGNP
jgi:hypothetical protein